MFAEDLIYLFERGNIGVYGRTLFKGSKARIPAGPGPFTSVIETGGSKAEGTHNDGPQAYIHPSAQLVFRAEEYDVARAKARDAYSLLSGVMNQFVNGTWWRDVTIVQEPFDLQEDEVGRARVVFNIDVTMRQSPAAS